jgi:hypothetical protein
LTPERTIRGAVMLQSRAVSLAARTGARCWLVIHGSAL